MDPTSGRMYYWNRALGTSQWDPPVAPKQTLAGVGSHREARRIQSLGGDDEEDLIGDASGDADWPADLPGAYGDDTSWIVGMHREPLWSDAQTYAAGGLTVPAEKGRADHGHALQRTTNPFYDKRRTFDPYAQASEEGRAAYPWDPFKDPQYYGDADCSEDGKLTDECLERPDQEALDAKRAAWREKYDEWYDKSKEEKAAEAGGAAAKKASAAGAMLKHADEVLPWARRRYSQFRDAAQRMKAAADRDIAAIAAAGAHQKRAHYQGGEPVANSLGRVLKRVQGEVGGAGEMLHNSLPSIGELERKFLRARRQHTAPLLRAASAGRMQQLLSLEVSKTGKGDASIWESPLQVAKHGLFGLSGAAAPAKAKKKLIVPTGKAAKGKGPLPAVKVEALRVLSHEHHHADGATHKAKQAPVKQWQQKDMQQGAMQRESTEANLAKALKDHDDQLLKKKTGLSWGKISSLEDAAKAVEMEISPAAPVPRKAAPKKTALKPWEETVLQQGALKHEGVEDNLKSALGQRTLQLLKSKAGWQSEKELLRAEKFAANLEQAIDLRRKEEKKDPLIPVDLDRAIHKAPGNGARPAAAPAASKVPSAELSKARAEAQRAKLEAHHDERMVQRIAEDRPIVKAYEDKVETDEKEYEAEVAQERATLADLHHDQLTLAKQVAQEEHPRAAARAKALRAPESAVENLQLQRPDDDSAVEAEAPAAAKAPRGSRAAAPTRKAAVPPEHGLSSAAADSDIDAYFATEAKVAADKDEAGTD